MEKTFDDYLKASPSERRKMNMSEILGEERLAKTKEQMEAAGEYASDSTGFIDMTAYNAFIAGAKWQAEADKETIKLAEDHAYLAEANWQKEQMMKDGNVTLAEEDFDAEKEKSMEWGYNLCKEQMLKDAVEGEFANTPFPTICLDDCKDYNFKDNQKVRIIVLKAEEE